MRAAGDGSIVLKFVGVLGVVRAADLRAAAVKGAQHLNRGTQAVGREIVLGVIELESDFIDHARGQDSGFGDLDRMERIEIVIGARNQIESAYSRVRDIDAIERVPNRQRVLGIDLEIESRAGIFAALRHSEYVGVGIHDPERNGIENAAVDHGAVVHRLLAGVQEKRSTLADGTAHVAFVFLEQERSLLLGEGVARIPPVGADVELRYTVKLFGARFGEDFDADE